MNINSRAYRTLHPRGKAKNREAMEKGNAIRKLREAKGFTERVLPSPPNQTNHMRHRIRQMQREHAEEKETA